MHSTPEDLPRGEPILIHMHTHTHTHSPTQSPYHGVAHEVARCPRVGLLQVLHMVDDVLHICGEVLNVRPITTTLAVTHCTTGMESQHFTQPQAQNVIVLKMLTSAEYSRLRHLLYSPWSWPTTRIPFSARN